MSASFNVTLTGKKRLQLMSRLRNGFRDGGKTTLPKHTKRFHTCPRTVNHKFFCPPAAAVLSFTPGVKDRVGAITSNP